MAHSALFISLWMTSEFEETLATQPSFKKHFIWIVHDMLR